MADKRISQLIERVDIANNDVLPIVASGATTTNKVTVSTLQDWMQDNLDVGVTSVGITIGSTGTDVNVSGSPITSSGNITINIPTASATNRGLLSAADWSTFNSKQQAITLTTTGTSGAATLVSGTLNIPNYSTDLSGYVTLGTAQTITAQKTFTTSGSSDTMIISHGSGSGFALDVLKAGNGEAIRVTKTSGSGNAMTISGGNFEAGTIVKTGGTSSQFLKADGSVDSSTYLTTSGASSIYVPYTGATSSVNLGTQGLTAGGLFVESGPTFGGALNLRQASGFSLWSGAPYTSIYATPGNRVVFNFSNDNRTFTLDGSLVSASTPRTFTFPDATGTLALTTDIPSLAGYVTLATTQTITGAKTFDTTTSDFLILNSTNASGGALTFRRNGTNVGHIGNSGVLGVGILDDLEVRSGIGKGLHLKTDGGKLTLSSGGSVTLDGALNGTSASFTGELSTTSGLFSISGSGATPPTGGVGLRFVSNRLIVYGGSSDITFQKNDNSGPNLTILESGAATFSSSVTAASTSTSAPNSSNGLFLRAGSSASNFNGITFEGNFATDMYFGRAVGSDDLVVRSGTAENVRFAAGGNVGIGTALPARKFVVQNTDSDPFISIMGAYPNSGGILFGDVNFNDSSSAIRMDRENNALWFSTNGASNERMRITSGGQISSTATLADWSHVISNQNASSPNGLIIQYTGANKNNSSNPFLYCTDNFGASLRFVVYSNGNVENQNNSYGAISDIKLKENIEDATPKLDDLMKVKVRNYNLIGDEKKQIGVIAQELEEIFPSMIDDSEDFEYIEVAQLDEEGNEVLNEEGEVVTEKQRVSKGTSTKSVKYSIFVPMLIKAIQELKTEIDSLKNQMQ